MESPQAPFGKSLQMFLTLIFILGLGNIACSADPTPTSPITIPTLIPVTVAASTPTTAATSTVTRTPTITLTPTRTLTPQPSAKDTLLAAYNAALKKIQKYRVRVIYDVSRQDSPDRIIEVILPDRFRQIQDQDIRQIGNTYYWFEPFPRRGTLFGLLPWFERVHLPWYAQQFTQASTATSLGRSTIDGAQLVGFQSTVKLFGLNVSDPKGFGKEKEYPIKVWFSSTDGMPVRMEVGQPLVFINVYFDINGKIDEIGPP